MLTTYLLLMRLQDYKMRSAKMISAQRHEKVLIILVNFGPLGAEISDPYGLVQSLSP